MPPLPRGRLAPSPTGALHLGNARTFLLAWLSIRSRGGSLVLRMEDLDHPKVKPHTAQAALDDLHWLGLDWDEGPDCGGPFAPYTQTERRACYREALANLLRQGLAYPCTCSRQEIEDAQSAPHGSPSRAHVYPGTCRGRYPDFSAAQAALPPDRLPVWRFRSSPGISCFTDVFCGEHSLDVASAFGDFPFARDPDGAGYQLACTLDDALMGITEVVRGDDLLETTHCQLALARALGLPSPRYCHVPLVVGPNGMRLAKRHGDTRICAFRQAGISPGRMIAFLAQSCGLAEPEEKELSPSDLLSRFSWGAVSRRPAVIPDEATLYAQLSAS